MGCVIAATAAMLVAARAIGANEAAAPDLLSPEERAWLAARGSPLALAYDPRWRVSDPEADPASYSGIENDFVALIEKKLGIVFALRWYPTWEVLLDAARAGQVDVLPAVRRTPEMEEQWMFTEPYIRIPIVLMVRKSLTESLTVEQVRAMRMGVGHKYAVEDFVRLSYPEFTIEPTKSDLDALLDLSVGTLDIVAMDLATVSHYIERHNIANLRIAGRVGPAYEFSMACGAGEPVLLGILAKGLAAVTDAERKEIADRWLRFLQPPFYRTREFWTWVGGGALFVTLLLLAILAWNWTLKRQVARTTRDLAQELAERRRAEEALSRSHAELEERVRERTHELAKANANLTRENVERRQAEAEVLEISSFERRRIGRDLHDSLGQQLAGIACMGEMLSNRLDAAGAKDAPTAARIAGLINDAIAHAKFIVRGLMPVEIVQEGLSHALRSLAAETSDVAGVECGFACNEPCLVYDNDVATNLYRIAQESIANAVKHGQARRITIGLTTRDLSGMLTIEDDGRGGVADGAVVGGGEGMGMRTMRYRAEMCGGRLSIAAREGGGTRVECTFQDSRGEHTESA